MLACACVACPVSGGAPAAAQILLDQALDAWLWQLRRELALLPKRSSEAMERTLTSPINESFLEGLISDAKRTGRKAGAAAARVSHEYLRAHAVARVFDERAADVPDHVVDLVGKEVGLFAATAAERSRRRGEAQLRAWRAGSELRAGWRMHGKCKVNACNSF